MTNPTQHDAQKPTGSSKPDTGSFSQLPTDPATARAPGAEGDDEVMSQAPKKDPGSSDQP